MKRLLVSLVFIAGVATAQPSQTNLNGAHFAPLQQQILDETSPLRSNNTAIKMLNASGTPVSVLSVDTSNVTVLNGSSTVKAAAASTPVAQFDSSGVTLPTSGETVALQEATAGAACMGTLTCNGASDVVTSTTCATTGSRIFLTRTSLDADTTGDFYVKSISNGVSFTVACELNDTGTLNWIIFHESP